MLRSLLGICSLGLMAPAWSQSHVEEFSEPPRASASDEAAADVAQSKFWPKCCSSAETIQGRLAAMTQNLESSLKSMPLGIERENLVKSGVDSIDDYLNQFDLEGCKLSVPASIARQNFLAKHHTNLNLEWIQSSSNPKASGLPALYKKLQSPGHSLSDIQEQWQSLRTKESQAQWIHFGNLLIAEQSRARLNQEMKELAASNARTKDSNLKKSLNALLQEKAMHRKFYADIASALKAGHLALPALARDLVELQKLVYENKPELIQQEMLQRGRGFGVPLSDLPGRRATIDRLLNLHPQNPLVQGAVATKVESADQTGSHLRNPLLGGGSETELDLGQSPIPVQFSSESLVKERANSFERALSKNSSSEAEAALAELQSQLGKTSGSTYCSLRGYINQYAKPKVIELRGGISVGRWSSWNPDTLIELTDYFKEKPWRNRDPVLLANMGPLTLQEQSGDASCLGHAVAGVMQSFENIPELDPYKVYQALQDNEARKTGYRPLLVEGVGGSTEDNMEFIKTQGVPGPKNQNYRISDYEIFRGGKATAASKTSANKAREWVDAGYRPLVFLRTQARVQREDWIYPVQSSMGHVAVVIDYGSSINPATGESENYILLRDSFSLGAFPVKMSAIDFDRQAREVVWVKGIKK